MPDGRGEGLGGQGQPETGVVTTEDATQTRRLPGGQAAVPGPGEWREVSCAPREGAPKSSKQETDTI